MNQVRLIFEWQWLHVASLAGLLTGFALATGLNGFHTGGVWGVNTISWVWLAVAIAVAHQVLVWFCWRTQLHLSLLTRAMGEGGFTLYSVLFSIIGIARVVVVFIVAISNQGTLPLDPTVLRILAVIAAIPAVYLFYSVNRYFGFKRAFGIDHFDTSYRSLPFVRKGIFRFTSNGMYVYGFMILWVPGLWYGSTAALCVALFNHVYIWVHYWSTERPDIRRMYRKHSAEAA